MAILTVDIKNDKDLMVLKEILNRFGLNYKIDQEFVTNKADDKLYNKFKVSFAEIQDWEAGKVQLQDAKQAVAEMAAELINCF